MSKVKGMDRKEFMSQVGKSNSKTNNWLIEDNVAVGITSKGEKFIIDKEDLQRVQKYCWRIHKNGYVVANSKDATNTTLFIHCVIMNSSDSVLVDHKDWDKLNNRKENLRLCTKSQNNVNIKRKSNNTSGYTGVKLEKRSGKWKAQISYNNQRIHLGTYESIEMAIAVRHEAEKQLHKEFNGEINRKDFVKKVNYIFEEKKYNG